jgi:hypothetical protein
MRPAISTSMLGAMPQTRSPSENSAIELNKGTAGPVRSLHMPAPTIPTTPLPKGAAKESA